MTGFKTYAEPPTFSLPPTKPVGLAMIWVNVTTDPSELEAVLSTVTTGGTVTAFLPSEESVIVTETSEENVDSG